MIRKIVKSSINYSILLILLSFTANNSYSQDLLESVKNLEKNLADNNTTVIIDKDGQIKVEDKESEEKEKTKEEKPKKKQKEAKKRYSIMLTDEESQQVEEALEALLNNETLVKEEEPSSVIEIEDTAPEEVKVKEQSQIYLDAILYESKENWITWINGNKITPKTNLSENSIYIESIDKESVTIKWKMGLSKFKALTDKKSADPAIYKMNQVTNQIEVDLTLKTNQTYSLTDNEVTEGRIGTESIIDDAKKSIDNGINEGLKKLF